MADPTTIGSTTIGSEGRHAPGNGHRQEPTADRPNPETVQGRPVRVAMVASGHPWRERFGAYVTEHEARIELEVVRDPILLQAGRWDLVLVDDTVPFIEDVVRCAAGKRGLIGVVVPDGLGVGGANLERRGVRARTELGTDPGALVDKILEEALNSGLRPQTPLRSDLGSRAVSLQQVAAGSGSMPSGARNPVSSLMTVGGPDSRLAAESAVSFAAVLSKWARTVLVDLDPRRPMAPRLGLELQPNTRDLITALAQDAEVDPSPFFARRQISNVSLPFLNVVGPTSSDRRSLPDDVEASAVLYRLARSVPFQVAAIGDVRGDNPSWVPAARFASLLIAVTDPTPVGLANLVEWMAVAEREVEGRLRIHVAFVGPAHGSRQARLEAELRDTVRPDVIASIGHVAARPKQLHDAQWRGGVPHHRVVRRFDRLLGVYLGVRPSARTSVDGETDGPSAVARTPRPEPEHPEPPRLPSRPAGRLVAPLVGRPTPPSTPIPTGPAAPLPAAAARVTVPVPVPTRASILESADRRPVPAPVSTLHRGQR